MEKRIEGLLADTRDHELLSAAAEDSVTPRAADAIRVLRQRVEQMGQQLQASTVPILAHIKNPALFALYAGICALQGRMQGLADPSMLQQNMLQN